MNYSYRAQIGISIEKGIDEENFDKIAVNLSDIFDGFTFEQDFSDRYDDFLAVYTARYKNVEFMLIGPPIDYEDYDFDDEPDFCQLNFVFKIESDSEINVKYQCDFISGLPQNDSLFINGKRLDVSDDIIKFINNSNKLKAISLK
ncbi:hypothetical protein [Vibrio quintilis]|nr:hypothetical protein [Vibrio quintilis]